MGKGSVLKQMSDILLNTFCRFSMMQSEDILNMVTSTLSFNYANIHAILPMIFIFFNIPWIFLEQKMIYHGYF